VRVMKLIFTKEELAKGLKVASSVAAGRNTLPILANVLIDAGEEGVTLAATDLQIGIRLRVKGEIIEPGSLTVPARKLSNLIQALDEKVDGKPAIVKLTSASNDRLRVDCGKGTFSIAGLPDDEFPALPSIGTGGYNFESAMFCDMLSRVASAASSNETRYFLCGVYLQAKEKQWTSVATDGKRLAMFQTPETDSPITPEVGVILPSEAVAAITRTFAETDSLQVKVVENQLIVAGDGMTLVSRLIEGEYPSYDVVIEPALSNDIVVTADAGRLAELLKRVSLLASPKTPSVKFSAKDGRINVKASTPEIGEGEDSMPCSVEGEIELAVNAAYMLGLLSNVATDEVVMKFKDKMSPVLLKEAEGDSYCCVLMPMRS